MNLTSCFTYAGFIPYFGRSTHFLHLIRPYLIKFDVLLCFALNYMGIVAILTVCICYDPDVKLSISRNGQANCPFHEMVNPAVHFVKWINPYMFCYPFHEMDKVMYER